MQGPEAPAVPSARYHVGPVAHVGRPEDLLPPPVGRLRVRGGVEEDEGMDSLPRPARSVQGPDAGALADTGHGAKAGVDVRGTVVVVQVEAEVGAAPLPRPPVGVRPREATPEEMVVEGGAARYPEGLVPADAALEPGDAEVIAGRNEVPVEEPQEGM